jgi:hypothetical protein
MIAPDHSGGKYGEQKHKEAAAAHKKERRPRQSSG